METFEFAGYQIKSVLHRSSLRPVYIQNETQQADERMEYIIPSLAIAHEAMFRKITLNNLRDNCVTRLTHVNLWPKTIFESEEFEIYFI